MARPQAKEEAIARPDRRKASRARIRTIKPEFSKDERVGRLTIPARLLWAQLRTVADDEGRLRGHARYLASELYPYDEDIGSAEINKWLDEIEGQKLVLRYEFDGQKFIQILTWHDEQLIRLPTPSALPEPPGGGLPNPWSEPPDGGPSNEPKPAPENHCDINAETMPQQIVKPDESLAKQSPLYHYHDHDHERDRDRGGEHDPDPDRDRDQDREEDARASDDEVRRAIAAFDEAGKVGRWPKANPPIPPTEENIRAILRKPGGFRQWEEALRKARDFEPLRKGQRLLVLQWFAKPHNFAQALKGEFDLLTMPWSSEPNDADRQKVSAIASKAVAHLTRPNVARAST